MRAAISLLVAAVLVSPAAAQERRTIPAPFHGDWALAAANCAPGPVDGGNMRVGRRTIRTFESRIDLMRVRVLTPDSIEFSSRVHHGGSSGGYQSRLTLLDDGARLAVGDGEEQEFYVRCRR